MPEVARIRTQKRVFRALNTGTSDLIIENGRWLHTQTATYGRFCGFSVERLVMMILWLRVRAAPLWHWVPA